MASQKVTSWFLSDTGKKFAYVCTGTASLVALASNFLPHTIFLDKYQNFVQLYRKGVSVPLTDTLKKRFEKAIQLCEVDEQDLKLFKPFAAYGVEIFSAGSVYSRNGVIVGLPINFTYNSPDEVNKSIIKLNNENVQWETEDGQKLLNSLVLSEKAQLYVMSREILFRSTPKVLFDSVSSSVMVLVAYGLGRRINEKLNLYTKPLIFRLVMYGIVSAFIAGNYFMTKDLVTVHYEKEIDNKLKQNPTLAEGGKEFYTKTLERNIALRKLLGKDGESLFTTLGNEKSLFRMTSTPLVQRKSFFEEPASA